MFWLALLATIAVFTAALTWWTRQAVASQHPYRRRARLLTAGEQALLQVLDEAAGSDARVFARVRVSDALAMQPGLSITAYRRARARIERQAFDFVICDRANAAIRCVAMIDPSQYRSMAQRLRARRLEGLCGSAGLGLISVSPSHSRDVEALRKRLQAACAAMSETPPLCPKCSAPMVECRGRSAALKHRTYWRCSRYSHCRTILPKS